MLMLWLQLSYCISLFSSLGFYLSISVSVIGRAHFISEHAGVNLDYYLLL